MQTNHPRFIALRVIVFSLPGIHGINSEALKILSVVHTLSTGSVAASAEYIARIGPGSNVIICQTFG